MKKVMLLLCFAIVLAGCGEKSKGIEKDDEVEMSVFSFDGDDFKEAYEENTGKSLPVSFEMSDTSIGIENANNKQVEGFLKTAHDLLGDNVIDEMYKSFKEDRDELEPGGNKGWRKVEGNDRLFLDYGILEDGKYMSSVYVSTDEEE